MSNLNSRVARIVAGLAVVSAFAVAPMAAQAADTDVTGTLGAGSLTNTAPAITPFGATLTGIAQTANTDGRHAGTSRTRPAATTATASRSPRPRRPSATPTAPGGTIPRDRRLDADA